MANKRTYFIEDLFRPAPGKPLEYVKKDDPFLSLGALNKLMQPDTPYCNTVAGQPISLESFFGKTFFDEANKVQAERESDLLAADVAQQIIEENKLREEKKIKNQLDQKVEKLFNEHKVFVKKACPVKIPYKSQLTHEEHETYLAAFLKYQNRSPKTSLEHQEYQAYLSLQNRVFEEQNQMMEFAKKVSEMRLQDYNRVDPAIEQYVERHVQASYKRVLNYPRLYQLEQEIPICPQYSANICSSLQLRHTGHLLSLGTVPWIKLPYPQAMVKVAPEPNVFLKKHPPNAPPFVPRNLKPAFDENKFLYKTVVSEDPNCDFLAVQHRANIVITPSALKTLLDNPGPSYDKEWDIPITVRSYPSIEPDGSCVQHRVVFLDKPIAAKLWTPQDKKSLFYKKATLRTITCHRPKSIFSMQSPPVFKQNHHHNKPRDFDCPTTGPRLCYEPSVSFDQGLLSSGASADPSSQNTPQSPFKSDASNVSFNSTSPRFQNKVSREQPKPVEESIFDDPFSMSEINMDEIEEFGVDKPTYPKKRLRESEHAISISSKKHKQFKSKFIKFVKCTSNEMEDNPNSDSAANDTKSPRNDDQNTKDCNTSNDSFNKKNILSNSQDSGICDDNNESTTKDDLKEESGGSVLDELLSQQDNMLKPKNSDGSNNLTNPSVDTSSKSLLKTRVLIPTMDKLLPEDQPRLPWAECKQTDWHDHNKARPALPASSTNYHYSLCQLGTNSGTTTASTTVPPVTLLVRHQLHGLSLEKIHPKSDITTSRAFVVQPKIENQVFFGAEVNTHTEVVHMWSQLLLRPNTSLLQARICSEGGEVVLAESRDLSDVLREGHQDHILFKPQQSLTSLYAVCHTLQRLMPGQYLLHHHNKGEAFIRLMKQADDTSIYTGHSSTIDLHASYGQSLAASTSGDSSGPDAAPSCVMDNRKYLSAPWLAIDTHVPTPFHLKHRKIPATFPMANPHKDNNRTNKQRREIKRRCAHKMSIYDDVQKKQTPTHADTGPEHD